MSNHAVLDVQAWEEFASCLTRDAGDTDRLMTAIFFRFEKEAIDATDAVIIANDYFRRARWTRPVNLAATANYCAGKGWIAEIGQADGRKLWRITRKGHDFIAKKISMN